MINISNNSSQKSQSAKKNQGNNRGSQGSRPFKRRQFKSTTARSEYDQKVIKVRRVARVVAGGRRFSFSATIVLGNRNGSVGVGVGKAADTALAIGKAVNNAKKNMIKIERTKNLSIPYEVQERFCSSEVLLIPMIGKGLSAGSSVRSVLDLAGITNVTAKIISRSKNKLNNAQATIKALETLK